MKDPNANSGKRVRRILLISIILVLIIGDGVAWWWATRARTDIQRAQTEAAIPSTITVPVTRGAISRSVVVDCSNEKEFTYSPRLQASGEDQAVVTSAPLKAGDAIQPGTLVAEISSRPVIAARGEIPAFRVMKVGSRGADVKQLHAFLKDQGFYSGRTDAPYSVATGTAVGKLYEKLGYDPAYADPEAVKTFKRMESDIETARKTGDTSGLEIPTQAEYDDAKAAAAPEVPLGEIMFVTQLPANVKTMDLELGQEPTDGQLTVESGNEVLKCQVPGDGSQLHQGQRATVDSGAITGEMTVTTVAGGQPADDAAGTGGSAGFSSGNAGGDGGSGGEGSGGGPVADAGPDSGPYVVISLPKDSQPYSGPARVETEQGPQDSLLVPSNAIRTDDNGNTFVTVHPEGAQATKVEVTVEFEADGTSAISSSQLRENDPVEVAQ